LCLHFDVGFCGGLPGTVSFRILETGSGVCHGPLLPFGCVGEWSSCFGLLGGISPRRSLAARFRPGSVLVPRRGSGPSCGLLFHGHGPAPSAGWPGAPRGPFPWIPPAPPTPPASTPPCHWEPHPVCYSTVGQPFPHNAIAKQLNPKHLHNFTSIYWGNSRSQYTNKGRKLQEKTH